MQGEGNFVWHELMTTDPEAAGEFYRAVAGWTTAEMGATAGGAPYTVFSIPGASMGTAGMMKLTAEMQAGGARPTWMGYIDVADVDGRADALIKAGGKVHMPPTDIRGVGRFAVVADPHGAVFYIFKPTPPEGGVPEMPKPGTPGTIGWNELYAGNVDEAFAFYSGLFGWEKSTGVDMGAMGVYQLFALNGRDLGGMMRKMDEMPVPFWNYYITVEAIDAAIERVKQAGGSIINGPHPVPGGAWIVQGMDPQGAMFSLTAGSR